MSANPNRKIHVLNSKQVKALDKEIERQIENIHNTLTSVPGIGAVCSKGILAEIGDINRFDSHAALAKYVGFAWNKHQSADTHSPDF